MPCLIRQEGGDWRELAASLFEAPGLRRNGAATCVAPLGVRLADDPKHADDEADRSAEATHQHTEALTALTRSPRRRRW
jgi:hypothetical protein